MPNKKLHYTAAYCRGLVDFKPDEYALLKWTEALCTACAWLDHFGRAGRDGQSTVGRTALNDILYTESDSVAVSWTIQPCFHLGLGLYFSSFEKTKSRQKCVLFMVKFRSTVARYLFGIVNLSHGLWVPVTAGFTPGKLYMGFGLFE